MAIMSEEIIASCFQLITYVGTARSCFINAIQCAKVAKYDEAAEMLKQGDEAFVLGHHVHSDLAQKETNGQMEQVGLLLLHAEDQLMSAEGFRTIAEEFIAMYKRMDGIACAAATQEAAPAVQEEAAPTAQEEAAPTVDETPDNTVDLRDTETGAKRFEYVLRAPLGIHARPAGQLVKVVKAMDSTVTVQKKGGGSAPATKLMALMGLNIKGGDTAIITIEGGNVEANVQALKKFFVENL